MSETVPVAITRDDREPCAACRERPARYGKPVCVFCLRAYEVGHEAGRQAAHEEAQTDLARQMFPDSEVYL